jgi:hypothetical protein
MTIVNAILLLLVISLTAYQLTELFEKIDNNLARLMTSLILSFVSIVLISFILLLLSFYNFYLVIIITVLLNIIVLVTKKYMKKRLFSPVKELIISKWDIFVIAVILGITMISFMFPTEYIIGGRDPGVYTIQAVQFSNEGALDFNIDISEEEYSSIEDAIHKYYPGFYGDYNRGTSEEVGSVSPQFVQLYPMSLTLGYDVAGLPGLFRINSIWAMLAMFAMYVLLSKLVDKKIALAGSIILGLNPAQLWNAKITQTEIMTQALLLLAMFLFIEYFESSNKKIFIFTGVLIGLCNFVRIDAHLLGVIIALYILYVLLFNTKNIKNTLYFGISYFIIAAAGIIYAYTYSNPYFMDLWNSDRLKLLLEFQVLLLVLIAVIGVIQLLFYKTKGKFVVSDVTPKNVKKVLTLVLAIFLPTMYLYGVYVRPLWYEKGIITFSYLSDFTANSFNEFMFYVPETLVFLFMIGSVIYFYKKDFNRYGLLFLTGFAFLAMYLWRPSITPDHMWACRRWVTFSIPCIIIFAMYGTDYFIKRLNKRILKISLLVIMLIITIGFSLYQSRFFIKETMLEGYAVQFEELADSIETEEFVYVASGQIASPLRYIFGIDAFYVEKMENQEFYDLISSEAQLNYVGEYSSIVKKLPEDNIQLISSNTISGYYPEGTRGSYPQGYYLREYTAGDYMLLASDNLDKIVKVIQDTDIDNYANSGFYASEVQFTWTAAVAVINNIEIPDESVNNDLKLLLKVLPFEDEQALTVTVNGYSQVLELDTEETEYEIILPAEYNTTGTINIEMTTNTFNPLEEGMSDDDRELGVQYLTTIIMDESR